MIYIDKKHIHKANCRVQFMDWYKWSPEKG